MSDSSTSALWLLVLQLILPWLLFMTHISTLTSLSVGFTNFLSTLLRIHCPSLLFGCHTILNLALLILVLPQSGSEPRFEPEPFRTGLKVWSQVQHGPLDRTLSPVWGSELPRTCLNLPTIIVPFRLFLACVCLPLYIC